MGSNVLSIKSSLQYLKYLKLILLSKHDVIFVTRTDITVTSFNLVQPIPQSSRRSNKSYSLYQRVLILSFVEPMRAFIIFRSHCVELCTKSRALTNTRIIISLISSSPERNWVNKLYYLVWCIPGVGIYKKIKINLKILS